MSEFQVSTHVPQVTTDSHATASSGRESQIGVEAIVQRMRTGTDSLTPQQMLQLQRTVGNQAVLQLLGRTNQPPVQRNKDNRTGMPDDVKSQMESSFRTDFSDVTIHTNSQQASAVDALAYTQGNQIHFASGQYEPNTKSGQELLGHELAHVVQQRQGRVLPTTVIGGLPVNDNAGLEREADQQGRAAAQRKAVGVQPFTGAPARRAPLQRQAAGVIQRVKVVRTKNIWRDMNKEELRATSFKTLGSFQEIAKNLSVPFLLPTAVLQESEWDELAKLIRQQHKDVKKFFPDDQMPPYFVHNKGGWLAAKDTKGLESFAKFDNFQQIESREEEIEQEKQLEKQKQLERKQAPKSSIKSGLDEQQMPEEQQSKLSMEKSQVSPAKQPQDKLIEPSASNVNQSDSWMGLVPQESQEKKVRVNKEAYYIETATFDGLQQLIHTKIAPDMRALDELTSALQQQKHLYIRYEGGKWDTISEGEFATLQLKAGSELYNMKQVKESQLDWFFVDTEKFNGSEQQELVHLIRQENTKKLPQNKFAEDLDQKLKDTSLTVVRQENGVWRNAMSENEKKQMTAVTDLNKLSDYQGKKIYIDTTLLKPKDKEKLIELIAKAGYGEYAREVRKKIGRDIYMDAGKYEKQIEAFLKALDRLKEGVRVSMLPSYVGMLSGALDKLQTIKEEMVITNAKAESGLYGMWNDIPFTLTYAKQVLANVMKTENEWKHLDNDHLVRFTFEKAEYWQGKDEETVQKIRELRESKAYAKLPQGTQWQEENVKQRTGEVKDNQVVKVLSQKNIERLQQQVNPMLEKDEGLRTLYERMLNVKFTIKHATSAFHAIENTGILSSLDNLSMWNNAQKASGMSSANNVNYKGDGDFAFFRLEVGEKPMETRYGPTTMVAHANVLAEQGGWVSLHDQLVPLDRPAMRELQDKSDNDNVVRKSYHDEAHNTTGKHTRWTNEYTNSGEKVEINFLDEVFYGADIFKGIALSLVLEIARIGGHFKEQAVKTEGDAALGALLASIYRVEAKLPSSYKLEESPDRKVHHPSGDGRYYASGIIHPEGMAASAAYGECQSQKTLVESFISGYNTLDQYQGERAEAYTHKKLYATQKVVSGYEALIKLLENALQQAEVFEKAAISEDSWRKTGETCDLVKIAADLIEKRAVEIHKTRATALEWNTKMKLLEQEYGSQQEKKQSAAKDPDFEQAAIQFEQRFGDFCFKYGPALDVVAEMCKKIMLYMEGRQKVLQTYQEASKELAAQDDAWVKIGDKDQGLAGAVGLEIKTIQEVFKAGNLRERMTHIYNFMNRVLGRDIQANAAAEHVLEIMKRAQMNTKTLSEQTERLQKGNKHESLLSEHSAENKVLKEREKIRTRAWLERNPRKNLNSRTLGAIGTDVSPRELNHMKIKNEQSAVPTWHEGGKSWLIDESHEWSKAMRELSLPLLAGPSGHTNAFMQAAIHLGVGDLEAVKLAVIGQLVPIRAHSLIEILVAAEPFVKSGFVPGPEMYKQITPFSEQFLRDNVALDKKFPAEHAEEKKKAKQQ